MASDWTNVKLGEVTDVLTGFPFKSERYIDDPSAPRLLRGDNVAQGVLRWNGAKRWPLSSVHEVALYRLSEGDVILAMDRPWIEAGLKYASLRTSDLPALLVQRVARLRGSKRLDTAFLKHVIGSQAFTAYVLAVQTGTAVPHISAEQIKNFEFLLPSLAEQRAIAHILSTLDDKIDLNQRMNHTLETMARALFKSWFVDFDPVRAKAEQRRDLVLPKEIADLFPSRFVDSELGKIPEGWSTGPLLQQSRLLSGGTPKTEISDYWNGNIHWASAKDVSQSGDTFLVSTERTITPRGLSESATQIIPQFSSVIVARGATTGRMVLAGSDMAMNQTCYALVTTIDTPFALYCQLRGQVDALVQAAHGSVFDTITTTTFSASKMVMAPPSLLAFFEMHVESAFCRILEGVNESRTLANLRDTLLPRLISGELRVNDPKRFIERIR